MGEKLYAGAAKREISPSLELLAAMRDRGDIWAFEGIEEPIFASAIVLSDGMYDYFAHVNVELVMPLGNSFCERAAKLLGTDPSHILISCTHNHQAVFFSTEREIEDGRAGADIPLKDIILMPEHLAYREYVEDQALKAVQEAKNRICPAKIGAGKGSCDVAACRDWPFYEMTMQGGNREGYTDREINVLRIDRNDGHPIAVLIASNVHSAMLCGYATDRYLGPDFGGSVAREVAAKMDGDCVVIWAIGGAGNQNAVITGIFEHPDYQEDGTPCIRREELPQQDAKLILRILASRQADAVMNIYRDIREFSDSYDIRQKRTEVSVPGRRPFAVISRNPGEHRELVMEPGADVVYRFALVMICGIAFCHSNGEPYSSITRMVKDALPPENVFMFDFLEEHAGYLPDVLYDHYHGFGELHTMTASAWDTEKAFYESFRKLYEDLEGTIW